MTCRTRKYCLLASPIFIAAVGLLLLNDFFLKRGFPCWFTGKLSDFAGLFAFSVMGLILWPRRVSLFFVASWFVFWKIPLSQPLIDWWNASIGCEIGRTVDYTDLAAIAVVPLAWVFHQRSSKRNFSRDWCFVTASISLFAFCATSKAPTPEQMAAFHAAVAEYTFVEHQPTYALPFNRKELYQRIEGLGFVVSGSTGLYPDFNKHSAYILPRPTPQWRKPREGRTELFEIMFDVDNLPMGVQIRVTKIQVKRGSEPADKNAAVKMFEARVIQPLRAQLKPN